MSSYLALLIGIVIIAFVSLFLYRLGRKKSSEIMKYIPSIVAAISIALVYFKMIFISQRYEPITDIVIMINLSFVFGITLLVAVLMDIMSRRKKSIR
jgi:ABC-type Mn2+/Zn2+ transport system permease subunit